MNFQCHPALQKNVTSFSGVMISTPLPPKLDKPKRIIYQKYDVNICQCSCCGIKYDFQKKQARGVLVALKSYLLLWLRVLSQWNPKLKRLRQKSMVCTSSTFTPGLAMTRVTHLKCSLTSPFFVAT